jgi:hypothetical protein
VSFRERKGQQHTIESLSCSSSSFLFAAVLSFLASSARLTESFSFLSLACNLCSISCRFFAYDHPSGFFPLLENFWFKRTICSPLRLRFSPYLQFWPCLEYRQGYQTWTFLVCVHGLHQNRNVAVSCSHFPRLLWGFLGFLLHQFGLHLREH